MTCARGVVLAVRKALRIGLLVLPIGLSAVADPCIDIDFVKSMAGVPAGTLLRTNAHVMVYGLQAKQFPSVHLRQRQRWETEKDTAPDTVATQAASSSSYPFVDPLFPVCEV